MKNVIIIGGGISGLATLHYLKSKYSGRSDIHILLLEKNNTLGGTATTLYQDNCMFESGPNGFLDSKENTLQFIKELNLDGELIRAGSSATKRFLSLNNKLIQIPTSPKELVMFPSISIWQKLKLLCEIFVPRGIQPHETVYEFGVRRFGKELVEVFLDPMVRGIFAGDIRQLNLKLTFPRIYEIEQKYGSLIRGMIKISKERKGTGKDSKVSALPGGTLTSFKGGMSQLGMTLFTKYKDSIMLNQEVLAIKRKEGKTVVNSIDRQWNADELYLCSPAYSAAQMLKEFNSNLAELLEKIDYVPVAVVGLVYPRAAFKKEPVGFGYLIPSREKRKALGVLFESNIFHNRTDNNHFLLRVMLGGSAYQEIRHCAESDLLAMARDEVKDTLQLTEGPERMFVKLWPRAIPQYGKSYYDIHSLLGKELTQEKGFFVVSNYWGGVSMNDCIMNAKMAAQKSRL